MKRFRHAIALLSVAAFVPEVLAVDVLTNRGNNARTGLNADETILTPTSVASSAFGLLYNRLVDGQVYAQPLYTANQLVTSNGQTRLANVLYVATEHDSLYAFDADTGTLYWRTALLAPGESPVSYQDVGYCGDLVPEIGITATPVIDRAAGPNGTIFVLTFSKNSTGTSFFHRLHAVDLSTGVDRMTPVVIAASIQGNGPATTFVPLQQRSRAGLLLLNGDIYTCWASYCDDAPYAGWIIGYRESDLSRVLVLNTDPNGSPASPDLPDGSGNAIWQSGNAPAVDAGGNIYVATGNGPFDTNLNGSGFPTNGDYGDSVLKLTSSLSVSDYFTPFNQLDEAISDTDLGSGGPVVLPDIVDQNGTHQHLLVQIGKDSNLYLLNRDKLGEFNPSDNSQIYQELLSALPGGSWSSAAYFNGSIYCGSRGASNEGAPILQFRFSAQAKLNTSPSSSTNTIFEYPGATPTISANGTANGIVWAYENAGLAILHAYDANNLATELFNSSRWNIGAAVKFSVPTVCNGKVFVGTANSVAAFALNHPGSEWHLVGAGDFDNNGQADLVWENATTGVRAIWLMNDGVFTGNTISLGTVSTQWHIAGVGNFGNGQSDLVWENTTSGARAIWLLNNGAFQSSISLGTVSTQWHIGGVGDFLGNGQSDLVWENTVTGQHAIWILSNGRFQSAISLPTIGGGWHVVGAGNFNGDGKADLVWENRLTGQRAIWLMNNGLFTGATINLGTVDPSWHIDGVGDFLGNGQSDLVWENTATTVRAIWILNNGSFDHAIALP
jgi:FG-GAP-like repeat